MCHITLVSCGAALQALCEGGRLSGLLRAAFVGAELLILERLAGPEELSQLAPDDAVEAPAVSLAGPCT